MARERQSRAWWSNTVTRWRGSGLTAAEFAAREDLSVMSLRWWSSALGRDSRATHGSSGIEPIEISVATAGRSSGVEIAVGGAVVRCEVGVDVDYVAALARALRGG
jgi:hypothetical protein